MQIICNNKDMVSAFNLDDLKKIGVKITAPRREILNIIASQPMSAQEVKDALSEKGFNVDLVTVYRTLELFENLNLIRRTEFEDHIARFEKVDGDAHHHHLVCIKCGIIEDVTLDESKLTKEIEKQSEFKIERHALEFFGFCRKCKD